LPGTVATRRRVGARPPTAPLMRSGHPVAVQQGVRSEWMFRGRCGPGRRVGGASRVRAAGLPWGARVRAGRGCGRRGSRRGGFGRTGGARDGRRRGAVVLGDENGGPVRRRPGRPTPSAGSLRRERRCPDGAGVPARRTGARRSTLWPAGPRPGGRPVRRGTSVMGVQYKRTAGPEHGVPVGRKNPGRCSLGPGAGMPSGSDSAGEPRGETWRQVEHR